MTKQRNKGKKRAKPGRPSLPESEKACRTILIKLTPLEKQKLNLSRLLTGETKNAFIRRLIREAPIEKQYADLIGWDNSKFRDHRKPKPERRQAQNEIDWQI